MDEDTYFEGELHEYVTDFVRIIKSNSPKRDDDSYPHEIKRKGKVISPFPGNLQKNGNEIVETHNGYKVKHGYRPAMYALYANKTSRKPEYIEKSIQDFAARMKQMGWEEGI